MGVFPPLLPKITGVLRCPFTGGPLTWFGKKGSFSQGSQVRLILSTLCLAQGWGGAWRIWHPTKGDVCEFLLTKSTFDICVSVITFSTMNMQICLPQWTRFFSLHRNLFAAQGAYTLCQFNLKRDKKHHRIECWHKKKLLWRKHIPRIKNTWGEVSLKREFRETTNTDMNANIRFGAFNVMCAKSKDIANFTEKKSEGEEHSFRFLHDHKIRTHMVVGSLMHHRSRFVLYKYLLRYRLLFINDH